MGLAPIASLWSKWTPTFAVSCQGGAVTLKGTAKLQAVAWLAIPEADLK
jgi:hypothetical protein